MEVDELVMQLSVFFAQTSLSFLKKLFLVRIWRAFENAQFRFGQKNEPKTKMNSLNYRIIANKFEKIFVVVFILYITAISKIIFAVLFSLPFPVYFVSNIGVLNVGR